MQQPTRHRSSNGRSVVELQSNRSCNHRITRNITERDSDSERQAISSEQSCYAHRSLLSVINSHLRLFVRPSIHPFVRVCVCVCLFVCLSVYLSSCAISEQTTEAIAAEFGKHNRLEPEAP